MSGQSISGEDVTSQQQIRPVIPTMDQPRGGAVLDDLAARGLVADSTELDDLRRSLEEGSVTVYCGLDPTADSLHVGNLQALLLLRRFQLAGHRPIALVGGATGRIGDPGGRDAERPLLNDEEIDHNVECLRSQYRRFVDFDDGAQLVDNREWTAPMGVIEFLRDVGKHVSVNVMMGRDSVKNRIGREGGLSFTEFSYQLLQANDFKVLFDEYGCTLQVAGSDQWGNILAGVDLIRRTRGATVHGLTAPLITDSEGRKFGKSTGGGQLWLDEKKTSPYSLYQYFVSVSDDMVEQLLLRLTLLPVAECQAIARTHSDNPGLRSGQHRVAHEIVSIVHGAAAADNAASATALLFGGDAHVAEVGGWRMLERELPLVSVRTASSDTIDAADIVRTPDDPWDLGVVDLATVLTASGTVKSKGEVRRNPGAVRLNGAPTDPMKTLVPTDFRFGRYALVQWGKSKHVLAVLSQN